MFWMALVVGIAIGAAAFFVLALCLSHFPSAHHFDR